VKKGPLAEAQIVAYLRGNGFPDAERRVMGGSNDRGDVAGVPGIVIEVKNHAAMALAEWVDEATREANVDGTKPGRLELPVVWHKRRGRGSPADWYVTMTGADFMILLQKAGDYL